MYMLGFENPKQGSWECVIYTLWVRSSSEGLGLGLKSKVLGAVLWGKTLNLWNINCFRVHSVRMKFNF